MRNPAAAAAAAVRRAERPARAGRRASFAAAFAAALLASSLPAHGGQYSGSNGPPPPRRGPGGIPAPSPPLPPAPGGPAPVPAPASPGRPGPATGGGPAAPGGGPGTPIALEFEADESAWETWWELRKARYLQVDRSAQGPIVQSGSDDFFLGSSRRAAALDLVLPTADDIRRLVQPALKRALDATGQRDVVTACLIALAKAGSDHPDWRLVDDVLAPHLRSTDQEVRETAALAIGIAGRHGQRDLGLLQDLAHDTAAGRHAVGRASVDDRTRAFACYALGLAAARGDAAARHRAATALLSVLDGSAAVDRDVRVAAIHGIGLLAPPADEPAGGAVADLTASALGAYFERRLGPGEELVQAHCPIAIAQLCGRDGPVAQRWRLRFAAELRRSDGRRGDWITQSCALALGRMTPPVESLDADDGEIVALLVRTWQDHPDAQTRRFAVASLGRIGGEASRTWLLRLLPRAGRALEQPWIALALGVAARDQRDRTAVADVTVAAELRRQLRDARNPSAQGALALALGLCGDAASGDDLRRLLTEAATDELRGHACIGLALLGDRDHGDELRAVLQASLRRPDLLRQSAVALGVLGDRDVTLDLAERLRAGGSLVRLAALAGALERIGDRRSLQPLVAILDDDEQTALARAFAAAALGGIAAGDELPWNEPLRDRANYRAAVPTMLDGAAGVLDLL
ncbi:MAG: HEAT repeat domain-containing protein [Planctomycetota bacterium]